MNRNFNTKKTSGIFTASKKSTAAFALLLSLLLASLCLSGCRKASGTQDSVAGTDKISAKNGKITVVSTIFPEFDWVNQIAGKENAAVNSELLITNGVDLHSFQPSAKDIIKIGQADILVYAGGESDKWIKDVLKTSAKKDQIAVNLMEVCKNSIFVEEIKEGMMPDCDEDKAEDADNASGAQAAVTSASPAASGIPAADDDTEEEPEYDEHVWLSLQNAEKCCTAICSALCQKDSAKGQLYRQNLADYCASLNALDSQYKAAVSDATHKTLIFADRFPFRYLTQAYGLDYFAAFAGCSAETEASFETIAFLAKKAAELQVPAVFTIENSDQKLARTVIQNAAAVSGSSSDAAGSEGAGKTSKDVTAIRILTLDSMQNTTLDQWKKGKTYISTMEQNLEVLKQAL